MVNESNPWDEIPPYGPLNGQNPMRQTTFPLGYPIGGYNSPCCSHDFREFLPKIALRMHLDRLQGKGGATVQAKIS
jgi:hypothetical protein